MMANPSLIRAQISQLQAEVTTEHFQLECLLQASWEGRHAAAKWLIEFIGIDGMKEGKALAPSQNKGGKEHDFRIDDLGGRFLDPSSPEAVELAQLRHDINKATSHPTHASGHTPISDERLRSAVTVIVKHLIREIYQPAGENI